MAAKHPEPDADGPQRRRKRKAGEGSYTTLPNGTRRLRISVGRDSSSRAIYKDFIADDDAACRAKYDTYMAANPSGPPSADRRQPLGSLLATWLETADFRPHTYEDRVSAIKKHITLFLGRTPICDLSAPQLEQWMRERRAAGVGGRTVEKCHGIIRAALNKAIAWGILETNVAERVKAPSYQKRKAKALTIVQAQAFIAAAEGRLDLRKPYKTKRGQKHHPKIDTRWAPLYLLYLIYGPRRGEPLALRWSDYDADTGALSVERSVDLKVREGPVKTESGERVIYLDDVMRAVLATHRTRMQGENHQEGWKQDGLMFPTTEGTVINPSNVHRHFKSVLAAAGLPRTIRLHDLRHSAASLALAEGSEMISVSKMLGHSNPAITAKLYGHAYEEGQRRAAEGTTRRIRGGT